MMRNELLGLSILFFVMLPLNSQPQGKVSGGVNEKQHADSVMASGVFLYERHKRSEAIPLLQEAYGMYTSLGDTSNAASALEMLGFAHRDEGRYDSARTSHEHALTLRTSAGDSGGMALSLNNIGECYQYQSEYERAIDHFTAALEIVSRLGDSVGLGVLLTNTALNHAYLGQYDSAATLYERALPIHRAMGNTEGEAKTYVGLGYARYHQKRYDGAAGAYRRGLRLLQRDSLLAEEAATLGNLALVYSAKGQRTNAMRIARDAKWKAEKAGSLLDAAVVLYKMGMINNDGGNPARALEYLHEAEASFIALGLEERLGMVHAEQMRSYRRQRNPVLAILTGKLAINAFQSVRRKITGLDGATQREFLATKEEAYRELAAMLIDAGRLAEAELVLKMIKEDEYLEFVRGRGETQSGLELPLSGREEDVAAQRASRVDTMVHAVRTRGILLTKQAAQRLTNRERNELTAAERKIIENKKRIDALLADAVKSMAGTDMVGDIAGMLNSQSIMITLGEIGPGTVAIYSLVSTRTLYLMLVTANARVPVHRNISSVKVNKLVAEFRAAISDPMYDPRPAGKKLYDLLLFPFRRELAAAGTKTIMWNLHGTLRYIPMAALHDGNSYMVEKYKHSLFTIASLSRLNDPPDRKRTVLGLGVSKAHLGFPELPFVPRELNGIVQHTRETGGVLPGVLRLDEEFNYDTLLVHLKRRHPLVHIATHFDFRPGNETRSFLLLGDGTRLSLDKLHYGPEVIFRGVELLTLSACNTATGSGGEKGSEVESFAAMAENLGCKSVMATLWPVYDASTSLLMQSFYKTRESEQLRSKADALQSAQLALLRGEARLEEPVEQLFAETRSRRGTNSAPGPETGTYFSGEREKPFAHPYYWAPFVLIGNWR